MGKTYRYDPETGCRGQAKDRNKEQEPLSWAKDDAAEDAQTQSLGEVPEAELTVDWAVDAMAKRIGRMVDFLVHEHYITDGEREDFSQEFNLVICRAMASYRPVYDDPEVRVFAARAFLRTALDNAMKHIKMHICYRNSRYKEVPFAATAEEAYESGGGALWVDDAKVSDKYASIRNLVLEMDKDAIRDRLAKFEEKLCFDLKCAEHPDNRIAEILGWVQDSKVERHHVSYVLLERIRAVMRKCGYLPKSEEFKRTLTSC